MNQCTGKKRARGGSEKVQRSSFSLSHSNISEMSELGEAVEGGKRILLKLCCPNMNLDSLCGRTSSG